ncbi:TadG family pilus assembly protein [Orrella sp. JC864]|uniref:TadG family pilus assembly protein n=1 Tax=Orrella sp. JC864 TaxID=3120298 RepID=UPI0030089807
MHPLSRVIAPRSTQQGSILVPVAASLLVGVLLLGAAQFGYMFHAKRTLQNTADLAALSAAQQLTRETCGAALAAANRIIEENRSTATAAGPPQIDCGYWDPPEPQAGGGAAAAGYFEPRADGSPLNAVRVALRGEVPLIAPLFGASRQVEVRAIARREDPVAVFSVGSRLLRLQGDSIAGQLLGTLGLSVQQIDALSASGLATTHITPAGLLEALGLPPTVIAGVGTPDELLRLQQLTLGELLQAYVAALSNTEGVAQTGIDALAGLIAGLRLNLVDKLNPLTLPVSLFGEGGVFALVTTGDPISALMTRVNALDLVSTTLLAATGSHLLDVPSLSLPGVQARARVIDPAQIAIGGVGVTAFSPQVRVYARVSTDAIPLVGGLLGLLNTHIDVPLILEVGRSEARLENICEAPLARNEAEVAVVSNAARLCLGSFPRMAAGIGEDSFFSSENTCSAFEAGTVPDKHRILRVLGILELNAGGINLPVLDSGVQTVTLTAPEQGEEPEIVTVTPQGNVDLGSQIRQVIDQVEGGLLNDLLGASDGVAALPPVAVSETVEFLLGPSRAGRSLTEITAEQRYSAEALRARGEKWASGAILNGLLSEVGALLNVVLAAPLGDTVCGIAGLGGAQAVRNCKRPYVEAMVKGKTGITALVSSILLDALDPLLTLLSQILQSVLRDVLGISLGQTDLSLYSVRCGESRLVY